MNDSDRGYLEEILKLASAGAEPLAGPMLRAASDCADGMGFDEGAIFPAALLACAVDIIRGSFEGPERDAVGTIVGEWVTQAISAPSKEAP